MGSSRGAPAPRERDRPELEGSSGSPRTRQTGARGELRLPANRTDPRSDPGAGWPDLAKPLARARVFIDDFPIQGFEHGGCSASCFSAQRKTAGARPRSTDSRARPMKLVELIDDLYEAFAGGLEPSLSVSARDLPRALRLAPSARPWSGVFRHEIVLGAPALFTELLPGVPSSLTRDAVLAHLLAVIDSFGTARIEDERIEASPQVFAVLGHVRRERERAMMRLYSRTPFANTDFRSADAMTIRALRRERATLKSGFPVDIGLYERILVDKRCSGLLASVALARIGGLGPRRCRAVRATL